MAVTRAKDSSVNTGTKYISFLAGNPAFVQGGFDSIATATPSGTNSVTFSSIPQTYTSLHLRMAATSQTNGWPVYIFFNGNATTSSYAGHALYGNGSSAGATGYTNGLIFINEAWNGIRSTFPLASLVDVHDYTSTTRNKTVRTFAGCDNNSTAGAVGLVSGLFLSTSAITSLTVQIGSGQLFESGSSIALYGVKSA